MNNYQIQLDGVSKHYLKKKTKIDVLNNVNLQVERGEFVVILGSSGSGKSTLLSLIAGLDQPSSGHIRFNDQYLNQMSQHELALLRRENIGFIFQDYQLMEMMTALENTEIPLLVAEVDKKQRRPIAVNTLEMVGLKHRMANYPEELSGGEKQRVGIARALVNRPTIILADEPTGDLDVETGNKIKELLVSINQKPDWNTTIIMVTHDKNLIDEGMRVLKLVNGSIIEETS